MKQVGRERWLGALWLGAVAALLLLVVWRCFDLQHNHVRQARSRASHQQRMIIPQSARRGMIVDRAGRVLAMSNQAYSVSLDPSFIINNDDQAQNEAVVTDVITKLAACLSLDDQDLRHQFDQNRHRRFMRVKRFISQAEAQTVRELNLRGVILQREYTRRYPMGQLAAQIIGFTSVDGTGLAGIERRFEKDLAGKEGRLLMRMDVQRRPIGWREESEGCVDGLTVSLTLDMVIQEIVEKQLELVANKFNAKAAIGIVMEPKTGDILAMGHYPTFNLEYARQMDPNLWRVRAITDPVEPGSTFKPFTVAAALHYGLVNVNDTIFCHNGRYSGPGFGTIKEYNYHSYGNLTVAEIILRSSNVGTAILAQRLGKKRFYEMLRKFGFGRKTGIELHSEDDGILRPYTQWTDKEYTLTRVGFGQGVAVTPIQLIRGFCALANDGKILRPHLVQALLSLDGQVVRDFRAEEAFSPLRSDDDDITDTQVISPEIAQQMVIDVLAPVVERSGGTARNAYLDEYRVFGKTGTAQVAKKDGPGYEPNKYVASFIAGAPAESPEICVLVMVNEPDRSLGLGYSGGRVAAEPVKEIIRQTLKYLQVPPQPKTD